METLFRPAQRLLARREYRYPFLDRDLVDFLLRVPPNQLKRPGRRRLLMRRALRNIVPFEVLERKRKAYIERGPAVVLGENKSKLLTLMSTSRLKERGYINQDGLEPAIAAFDAPSGAGREHHLMRAIQFELWLRRPANSLIQARFSS